MQTIEISHLPQEQVHSLCVDSRPSDGLRLIFR